MRAVESRDCPYEAEVLDAIAAGRWPDEGPHARRGSEELREHLTQCESCTDLADIAGLLNAEGERARAEVALPNPRLVWWRAQVRAREEAARTAARPIRLVQGLALSCAAGLGGTILGATSSHVQDLVAWLGTFSVADLMPASLPLGSFSVMDLIPTTLPIAAAVLQRGVAIGVITWLVLAPLAIYLAFAAEE